MNKLTIDREERYTVIKHKDLTADDRSDLDQLIQSRHIPTRECLVIESDWPEYEPAWRMIEARMTGAAPSAPKADDPVKQMLLEALEKVDSEHEILGWMKTCELRRGRGSFGIAVMSDELALDWQSHQKNLERLIGLRHAAIAAARKESKV